VRWLRSLGYKANDTVLTRSGAAKLVKGSNRPVWEFLMAHARPAAEAQQIREDAQAARQGGFNDAQEVKEAKQRARLRAERRQQQEQNRAMQEMLNRQAAHLQARLAETVSEQGKRESSQQEAHAVGAQINAAACYRERMLKAMAALRQIQASLVQAATEAKGWATSLQAQAAKAPPGQKRLGDTDNMLRVAQACASVQAELQTRSLMAMQQGDLRGASTDRSGTILLAPPSNSRELQDLRASPTSPLITLDAIIQVMQQSIHSIKEKCAAASPASGAGPESEWDAAPSSRGPNPQLLLRQRQQAHVDKFFATEDILNQVDDIVQLIRGHRKAAEPLLAWPYNHLRLQEAWLLAELSMLQSELGRLNEELVGRHRAEAALQDQWRNVYEASCYSQQAHGLLERLIKENRDMTVRWEEDAAGHQAWCKGTLSDSAEATALTCRLGMDVVQSELRAAGQLNLAACPPCLPSLMEAGASERGRAAAFAHHHRRGSSLQQLQQQQQATVLFSYSRALPVAVSERSSGLSSARQKPTRPPRGGPLPLVLQAACLGDTLAPLRCPATVLCSTADCVDALKLMRTWLRKCQPWLSTSAQQAQARLDNLEPLQQQVMQLIHPPSDPRLAVVKKYVATAQGMQTYAQKRVGRALSDWKNLPAVHLLPDVQYAGLCAAEWLSAIQALLASIREAQGIS